jgi:aldehyde dehydrogenase (NAD+)
MSDNNAKFFIDGRWVKPTMPSLHDVINPATEEVAGQISFGSSADVDLAVSAARRAFAAYSATTRRQRLGLLRRIIKGCEARSVELAQAMTAEMGSPITFSKEVQAVNAVRHFEEMVSVLKSYKFERFMGDTLIRREPIGVCGLITPWNWPLNQIASKLAPALAAGCTVVLKPSEVAPLSAIIFAEILHKAGVPKGVFNLVNGHGPLVGEAISSHPDIDMVSFTGSTRAGILVAAGLVLSGLAQNASAATGPSLEPDGATSLKQLTQTLAAMPRRRRTTRPTSSPWRARSRPRTTASSSCSGAESYSWRVTTPFGSTPSGLPPPVQTPTICRSTRLLRSWRTTSFPM